MDGVFFITYLLIGIGSYIARKHLSNGLLFWALTFSTIGMLDFLRQMLSFAGGLVYSAVTVYVILILCFLFWQTIYYLIFKIFTFKNTNNSF